MSCLHIDFDEYFEKCNDCGADKHTVLADNFKDRLQTVYRDTQEALGFETGDIEPMLQIKLEAAEDELANLVADWYMTAMDNL